MPKIKSRIWFLDQILDYLFWMYYIVQKLENAGFQPSLSSLSTTGNLFTEKISHARNLFTEKISHARLVQIDAIVDIKGFAIESLIEKWYTKYKVNLSVFVLLFCEHVLITKI